MVALIVLSVVLLFLVVFCLGIYFSTFFSPHKGQNDIHNALPANQYDKQQNEIFQSSVTNFEHIPSESVSIKSCDGLSLFGYYYKGTTDAPLIICFHGYRGTGKRDCSACAKLMLDNGYNVLVVEQRAQGRSGGHTITFGEKERQDCLSWVNFAAQRFGADVKIVLFGISMGATTVLMSLGLDLPPNVRGIIADCPYNSPKGILCKVCGDKKLSAALSYPFLWLSAVLFGRFNPSKSSAVVAVKDAKIPILLLHGESDMLVPCDMSREISAANPTVQLETFPNAPHGASFFADTSRYSELALNFVKNTAATAS